MVSPTRRRWFRFSLRTMLVLFTVLSIYLAWAVHWKHQRKEFLQTETAMALPNGFGHMRPPSPEWTWLIGELGYSQVVLKGRAEDSQIEACQRLFPEAMVTDETRPIRVSY